MPFNRMDRETTPNIADLSTINFLTEYRSMKDDPVGSFYRQCLRHSIQYRRAVGYFRSSVFVVVGSDIVAFSRRGGLVQLICSPELDPADVDAINQGYLDRNVAIAKTLEEQFDALIADGDTNFAARTLSTLIASGTLELKLAIRADHRGLYHEKLGVFTDSLGNRVSFKGSTNETWSGWHPHGNFESLEVFCSWRGGLEAQRVDRHESHFESLWSETDADVEVVPFPERTLAYLKRFSVGNLSELQMNQSQLIPSRRRAMPHQEEAIAAWNAQGQRGIFEHATGSGKTFTAMIALRNQRNLDRPTLVVVPSKLLLEQWSSEIRLEFPDVPLLLAGAGHSRWRTQSRLTNMTHPDTSLGARIVIATMQTASTDDFLSLVSGGEHLLVIADEVHQIGSTMNARLMNLATGSRLGLSATPKRFGDPEGTARISAYFGAVVPPRISLNDAIQLGRLVPYQYFPHPVSLDVGEREEWTKLTESIRKEIARSKRDDSGKLIASETVKHLLIRRSRIAKKASAKVLLAAEVLKAEFIPGQSWLIYCEDSEQMATVRDSLSGVGIATIEYHSGMEGDRHETLEWFRRFGGVLVSIRCLDEGVDIPTVTHALILASSRNPRQFIQRRGRVLRSAPGKHMGAIHDAIVLPEAGEDEVDQASLLRSELVRSLEFASDALNQSASAELRRIAINLSIDPDDLMVEEEDDNE